MSQYQILAVLKDNKYAFCVSIDIKTRKIAQMKKKYDLSVIELGLRNFINSQLR